MVRESTRPPFAIRYSSTPYSLEVSSTRLPALFTCCERRSNSKSPIRSTLARVTGPRRSRALTRTRSPANLARSESERELENWSVESDEGQHHLQGLEASSRE